MGRPRQHAVFCGDPPLALALHKTGHTLVDRRSRADGRDLLARRLEDEIERRGLARYETSISRSPRVESLNSASSRPLSILHHARGTTVHGEFAELARELLCDLDVIMSPRTEEGAPTLLWGRQVDRPAQRARASRVGEVFRFDDAIDEWGGGPQRRQALTRPSREPRE